MNCEAIGLDEEWDDSDIGACAGVVASARRHLHILDAVTKNHQRYEDRSNEIVNVHLSQLAADIAKLRASVEAASLRPRMPWWVRVFARVKALIIVLGMGHGRVALMPRNIS